MEQPQALEIRQHLDKILASSKFKDAARSRRFLEFIVRETLDGKGDELKENVVGVGVFDRRADYDPRLDSIVRVEAGRLRTKLNDYYDEEGRDDKVEIALPKGSYTPGFAWRSGSVNLGARSTETAADSALNIWPSRRGLVTIAVLVVAIGAATIVGLNALEQPASPPTRIAVLPFKPYTSQESDRLIADQLTQKVTAEFVNIEFFEVVPSTSARQYDERRPSIREIAANLHADVVLEARTNTNGDGVFVEVRLSAGAADRKYWVANQSIDQKTASAIDALAKKIARAASNAVLTRR